MQLKYPSLFDGADEASRIQQTWYLRLVKLEYALLILAAVLSMGFSSEAWYFALFGFVFVLSGAVLLLRNIQRPEQNWYFTRALAESAKTLTWRFVMRAEPFDSNNEAQDRTDFTNHLQQLLQNNKRAAEAIAGTSAHGDQFTPEMAAVRSLSLDDRKKFYIEQRIKDQRSWYSNKAVWNKRIARRWTVFGVVTYMSAFGFVMFRIVVPECTTLPIEPLIVVASAVIGWMQIKKFNELASAYTLTANEIGLIQARLELAMNESELSRNVNEAELAFSREHTQWVARQNS